MKLIINTILNFKDSHQFSFIFSSNYKFINDKFPLLNFCNETFMFQYFSEFKIIFSQQTYLLQIVTFEKLLKGAHYEQRVTRNGI